MNKVETALSMFRTAPYHYNCAQAVCAALGYTDLVEKMSSCGGGKAPDGMCGALYGAIQCVSADEQAAIIDTFVSKHGFSKCHELKKEGHVPCKECVATAVELICKS